MCVEVLYTATENAIKHCENTKGKINSSFATHYKIMIQHQRKIVWEPLHIQENQFS